MKAGLYPKLAWEGIRKNGRMYLPYILTCTGTVMMSYIIDYLHYSDTVSQMRGASVISEILALGNFVIAFFSCLFLFYTNSFLMKRRKKEFGLYNILGMGKRNLSLIILWETVTVLAVSLAAGLALGILFSKLAELILLNIIDLGINYSFGISWHAVADVTVIFTVIFALLLINSVRQVRFTSAINLLKSENLGEKPPKANIFLGLLGIALIAWAYYIALRITNPITAIPAFFVAVLMVIAGTYFMMIAGSVMICRLLQKIKRFYYRPNHFVSVSSMAFRMKRNGAGLASICILMTMVLVMISSTSTLYFGIENIISLNYPREIYAGISMMNLGDLDDETLSPIRELIDSASLSRGADINNVVEYRCAAFSGALTGSTVETDVRAFGPLEDSINAGLYNFFFVPLEDYNRLYGTDFTLSSDEAMLYLYHGEIDGNEITFNGGNTLKIIRRLENFELEGEATSTIFPAAVFVVRDLEEALGGLADLAAFNGERMIDIKWLYGFDTGLDGQEQIELVSDIWENLLNIDRESYHIASRSLAGREQSRHEYLEMCGGLFFLGILLSAVFICAAVLIIYYKQIAEGYEDCSRFDIMQKVGMTGRDIKKSINSQLCTVFYLPLVFAGLHLMFAFPMIKRMLLLFSLTDSGYYAAVTLICFAVLAALYTLVCKITSNSYYHIVRGRKGD